MSTPYIGQITIMGFNFAPRGWGQCNGQLLPINQNQALFSILGTTYGGDGRTTFALPDLRGRAAMHEGSGHALGQRSGAETHSLTAGQIPSHTHDLQATAVQGTDEAPSAASLPAEAQVNIYGTMSNTQSMGAATGNGGANQGHDNMQPFTVLNFCIAMQGVFPSRN